MSSSTSGSSAFASLLAHLNKHVARLIWDVANQTQRCFSLL